MKYSTNNTLRKMDSFSCDSSFLNDDDKPKETAVSSDISLNASDDIEILLNDDKAIQKKYSDKTTPDKITEQNDDFDENKNSTEQNDDFDILSLFGRKTGSENEDDKEKNESPRLSLDPSNDLSISSETFLLEKKKEIEPVHPNFAFSSQNDFPSIASQQETLESEKKQKLQCHPNMKLSTTTITKIKNSHLLKMNEILTVQITRIDYFNDETATLILSDGFDMIDAVISNQNIQSHGLVESGILTLKDFSVWRISGIQINIAEKNIVEYS